jgi:hypothetical protein
VWRAKLSYLNPTSQLLWAGAKANAERPLPAPDDKPDARSDQPCWLGGGGTALAVAVGALTGTAPHSVAAQRLEGVVAALLAGGADPCRRPAALPLAAARSGSCDAAQQPAVSPLEALLATLHGPGALELLRGGAGSAGAGSAGSGGGAAKVVGLVASLKRGVRALGAARPGSQAGCRWRRAALRRMALAAAQAQCEALVHVAPWRSGDWRRMRLVLLPPASARRALAGRAGQPTVGGAAGGVGGPGPGLGGGPTLWGFAAAELQGQGTAGEGADDELLLLLPLPLAPAGGQAGLGTALPGAAVAWLEADARHGKVCGYARGRRGWAAMPPQHGPAARRHAAAG